MKLSLILVFGFVFLSLGYFVYLGYSSQTGFATGLVNSKLSPCSTKPNCICSEYPDDKNHYTQAIAYQDKNLDRVKRLISTMGGNIISSEKNYLAAIYTSRLFQYVDDFEVRLDEQTKTLHIRSASRVGHSDMGANLKRIETFKIALENTN